VPLADPSMPPYLHPMRLPPRLLLLALIAGCNDDGGALADFCAPPVADSPVRGPDDAWVTMVEFADFQCPYCGAAEQTVGELLAAYPADLRLVFKHLPFEFHEHALGAAIAAQCAHEQGAFWEMHDLLLAHQEALDAPSLETYAHEVGLDLDAWRSCTAASATRQRIADDEALARQSGVRGTPTFFIDGEPIVGAVPIESFTDVVDSALATAQASGIAPESYYAGLEALACE